LTIVFNWKLRAFERGKVSERALFAWLVPLMALWANLHGAFPIGLIIIALYCAGNCWKLVGCPGLDRPSQRRKALVLAALFTACLAATLLNPNGWKLHAIIVHYIRDARFVGIVNEFLSPDFHQTNVRGFQLQLLLLAFILLAIRPKWDRTDLLVTLAWAYFALYSVRNLPIFSLLLTPIFAGFLEGTAARASRGFRRVSEDIGGINRGADGRIWMGVAIGLVLAAQTRWLPEPTPDPKAFPVAATQWLREHHHAVQGEMLSTDFWGSYLLLELPERKVFLDSRHEFYGADIVRDYLHIIRGEPGWDGLLDRYHVQWTLLPRIYPINQLLAVHPDWQRVYEDDTTTVFSR